MVTTHLVVFSFLDGASAVEGSAAGENFAGFLTVPPYYMFDGFTGSDVEPEPSPGLSELPGGSGKRYRRQYRTDSLDLAYWRKNLKKLEKQVENVQVKLQEKREKLDTIRSHERIEILKKQMVVLQKLLVELLGELDMARKTYEEAEMQDALAAYMAYRSLH